MLKDEKEQAISNGVDLIKYEQLNVPIPYAYLTHFRDIGEFVYGNELEFHTKAMIKNMLSPYGLKDLVKNGLVSIKGTEMVKIDIEGVDVSPKYSLNFSQSSLLSKLL